MKRAVIHAKTVRDGAYRVISVEAVEAITRESSLALHPTPSDFRTVESSALEEGIVPYRYLRNMGTVGLTGQLRLLGSTVAIAGAGGLGGWIIEGLARMGVGRLIIIDGDTFTDNNLNRQALCIECELGRPKVEAALRRVQQVNSAVDCECHFVRAGEAEFVRLVRGAQVVVDALDSLPSRFDLQRAAEAAGIPLVHGAIGGFVGQVMTVFPGDTGLFALYSPETAPERGIEVECGNPTATPLMVAAWQIHETIKLLLGIGQPLRHRLLMMDAESGSVEVLQLEG